MVDILIKSKTKKETIIRNVREVSYFDYLSEKQKCQISDSSDLEMNDWHGPTTFVGDTSLTIERKDIESIESK